MFHQYIFSAVYTDIVDVVTKAYAWGISVLIFGTAALLAVSLIGWLIHRS